MSKTITMYSVVLLSKQKKIIVAFENWHEDGTKAEKCSLEFSYDVLKASRIFTWSQLIGTFQRAMRDQGYTLGVPCYPSDEEINRIKEKLSQLRSSTWKQENLSHTLTINFSNSEEDQALWEVLQEYKDLKNKIKAFLADELIYGSKNKNES